MSFRDFNDEGPGTFEWDFVLGGNSTGLFPEELHYELDGNQLTQVTYRHIGGNKFEPVYGECWNVTNISEIHKGLGGDWFTFEQAGRKYKAVINRKYKQKNGSFIIDLIEL